jgi:hypothetical protein
VTATRSSSADGVVALEFTFRIWADRPNRFKGECHTLGQTVYGSSHDEVWDNMLDAALARAQPH